MSRRPTTRLLGEVTVGDALDELVVPLTRTLIVAGAIASRDYQDVHHDHELAHERGSPDIFMNILTTNGLVGRFVTDWSGPGGVLESVAIRLGAPNYPGDTMRLTGRVTAVGEPRPDGRGVVSVAVRGANRLGDHVTGTVEVALPIRPTANLGAGATGSPAVGAAGTPATVATARPAAGATGSSAAGAAGSPATVTTATDVETSASPGAGAEGTAW